MHLKIVLFFVFLVLIVIFANSLVNSRTGTLTRRPAQPLVHAAPAPQLLASVPGELANGLTLAASGSVLVVKSELSDTAASAAAATLATIDCSLIRQQPPSKAFFSTNGKE